MTEERRIRTRAALLDAARDLVFEHEHDKISIQEITNRAGVATGTFYNYFETKQDVFVAVVADYRARFRACVGEARANIKDPAMTIAVTLKYYFNQALNNEAWNTFVLHSGLPGEILLYQDEDQCLEDVRRGARAGRFKVDDPHFAQSLITGMVKHTIRQVQDGYLGMGAIDDTIRYVLRMLGLPDLVAKALVQLPMPAIQAPKRTQPAESATVTTLKIIQGLSA